jgi:hypothetical protein
MKHTYKQNDINKLPYRTILNRCIVTHDKKIHYWLERSFSGPSSLPMDGFKDSNPYPNQELIPISPVYSQFLHWMTHYSLPSLLWLTKTKKENTYSMQLSGHTHRPLIVIIMLYKKDNFFFTVSFMNLHCGK